MNDVIVVYLTSHIPAALFGLFVGLVIALVCVAVSSVRQYHKGLEDGYDRGRVQGAEAQHRIEASKRSGPDILLHRVRAAQDEAEAR